LGMRSRIFLIATLEAALAFAGARLPAAQDSSVLMPEESAAKAKQIMQQAINAMGGSSYMNVHDITCTGQLSEFDHSGQVGGFEQFIEYAIPPDKSRSENLPKRNIIEVYNGNDGWALDRAGVSDASTTDIIRNSENAKRDLDNILRRRIQEPDMSIRYGGKDIVDLQESDWVNLVDGDDRNIQIAFARSTHLPIRKIIQTLNPKTQTKTVETEIFSNYHPLNGIQTAFQITRERNGFKTAQVFFNKCDYNTGLADSLFTKASLDERWSQVGKKESAKDKKKDKKADSRSQDGSPDSP